MKPVLFLVAATAVLSAVPAVAQNGQAFDWGAQTRAYSTTMSGDQVGQCFNGRFISGVNRSGQTTLYVQQHPGTIYLRMADSCSALDEAQKLTVRSNGGNVVCSGDTAEAVAWTTAGSRRCKIDSVQLLNAREAAALASAARR